MPHEIVAVAVLPEHLHAAVIRMPDDDANYSRLWREIKKGFARRLPVAWPSLWQPRFWEHTIRDDADLRAHVDYVHFNPVKHGLVSRVMDWPFSSFHRHVRMGWLPADWGGDVAVASGRLGERPPST